MGSFLNLMAISTTDSRIKLFVSLKLLFIEVRRQLSIDDFDRFGPSARVIFGQVEAADLLVAVSRKKLQITFPFISLHAILYNI